MKNLFFLTFILVAAACFSQPVLDVELGLPIIFVTEAESAPSPVVLQGLGAAFPFYHGEGFFLDAGLFLTGTQYQYLNKRAFPADIERADTVWVLSVQLDARVGYTIKVSDTFGITLSGGPAIIARIPLLASDNGDQYMGDMAAFFFANLRFLLVEGQAAAQWKLTKSIGLAVKLRALFPISSIIEIAENPLYNGLQLQAIVALQIPLGGEESPAQSGDTAPAASPVTPAPATAPTK